jgi:hypothetical protein
MLGHHLPTRPARRKWLSGVNARNGQRGEWPLCTRRDRGKDGVALGADRQAVARRLDIAANVHAPVSVKERRTNPEPRIRRVREPGHLAGLRNERIQIVHDRPKGRPTV